MGMMRLQNKTSYNGFDLSTKRNFTQKMGQLYPLWWQYCIPGDKVKIDLSSFTRTVPINTAAFARIRQYFDFYFVPLEFLWNKTDSVITQMNANQQHATALVNPFKTTDGFFPHTDLLTIAKYVGRASVATATGGNGAPNKDFFGFNRGYNSARILEALGYGDFYRFAGSSPEVPTPDAKDFLDNAKVCLFPLAAYQKIYSDRYRYTQWERSNSSTYNFDYLTGVGDTDLSDSIDSLLTSSSGGQIQHASFNLFDLRYCNMQKDLFHGILPSAQYGSTSAVPLNFDVNFPAQSITSVFKNGSGNLPATNVPVQNLDTSGRLSASGGPYSAVGSLTSQQIQSSASLSILMLRQYEALQRWKEVAQAADEDYKSQIEAHWGIPVSDYLSHMVTYLGGTSVSLDINEVTNTNLAAGIEDNGAFIRGKGVGSGSGSIEFEAKDRYGIIMCVAHILPLVDYITSGVRGQNLIIDATSFPIPEMDNVGMELLSRVQLVNNPLKSGTLPSQLGYVPRYINWKTDYDMSFGAFRSTLQSWCMPFMDDDLAQSPQDNIYEGSENPNVPSSSVAYSFFKVNPRFADSLFLVAADDTVDTDEFWVTSFFNVRFTRKLDYNGLPY